MSVDRIKTAAAGRRTGRLSGPLSRKVSNHPPTPAWWGTKSLIQRHMGVYSASFLSAEQLSMGVMPALERCGGGLIRLPFAEWNEICIWIID
ncbi:hypothetical protein ACFLT7_07970 [candidate division KSB1 bacterium]